MMVDLRAPPVDLYNFRVQNSLGYNYALAPSNFALESALYQSIKGDTIMYTANGALTIQDPFRAGISREISLEGFSVFIIAVNQANNVLILGGVDETGSFSIALYSLTNPMKPLKFYEVFGLARLTSVATYGDQVAYTTTATMTGTDGNSTRHTFYSFFELPQMPPTGPPLPSEVPTQGPSVSSAPTVSAAPTRVPSTTPSQTPSISPQPTTTQAPTPKSNGVPVKVISGIFLSLVNFLYQITM
jgi:hypothetical protein